MDALDFETNLPAGVIAGLAPSEMMNLYRVDFFTDALHIATRKLIDISPATACEEKR